MMVMLHSKIDDNCESELVFRSNHKTMVWGFMVCEGKGRALKTGDACRNVDT